MPNDRNQLRMIGHEVERKRLQIKGHRIAGFYGKRLAESLCAGLESILPLKGAIDYGSMLYPSIAIGAVKGDMHCDIEGPKRFSTLWRSPHHGQAFTRNDALDQIPRLRSQFDFIERNKFDPRFRFSRGQCSTGNNVKRGR